jgi:hypothetical protein
MERMSKHSGEQRKISSESPVIQSNLTESTISWADEPECRAVSGDHLGRYLYLTIEQGWKRNAEKQRYHSAKLAAELTESQSESKPESSAPTATKLVDPATIKELLRTFELSVDDWQTVTASAHIGDLLRAARSLKAIRIGLPKDASEQEINAGIALAAKHAWLKTALATLGLKQKAIKALESIRIDPERSTHLLQRNGSIELGSYGLDLSEDINKSFATWVCLICSPQIVPEWCRVSP